MIKIFKASIVIPLIVLILTSSCRSQADKINFHGEDISISSDELLEKKILKDFETNRFTEIDANLAFLLAKTYMFNGKFEKAEKLLEINYKFLPTVTVAIALIQVKITLKKNAEAKDIALYANVIFSNNSDILLILIQIYQLENNIKEISILLDKAHKKFPKNESIAILFSTYSKKDSKKILIDFINQTPVSPNALLRLSSIFYQEKKFNEALKYAKKSYFYEPDNIDTIVIIAKIEEEKKEYTEAEKFYKIAFENDMESNINAQNYINILLFQKKQQVALATLLKLEASSDNHIPFPPEFSFEIGRILLLNQDYEGAKKRFSILSQKQNASVLNLDLVNFFLAYSLENLHLFNEALTNIEKIDPKSKIFRNAEREKIIIHINNNQKELAQELIKNFTISKDYFVEDTLFKASVLMFFNKNEEAIQILNEGIKIKADEKELYIKRIDAYIRANKSLDFIMVSAKNLVKKWPLYPDGLNLLGYLLLSNSKDLMYAEKLLLKSLSFDNKNAYYLDSLGCLYLKKKNLKLAQKYFIESLKYSPNEPVILYHYSKVLELLNDNLEATKTLEKARTIISNMLIYNVNNDNELKSIAFPTK